MGGGQDHFVPPSLTLFCPWQGSVSEILLNSLDILTFVVPPILPAALTANNAFAQRRLQARCPCIDLSLFNNY
jgi:magnesium-transporting ATPase (P-type)